MMIAILIAGALAGQVAANKGFGKQTDVPQIAPPPAPRIVPPDPGVVTGAKGNPSQYFSYDQYPLDALRANEQGRVVARLTISASGSVSDCEVVSSSDSASLDAATCRIALDRVKFTPALDATGKPIASHWTLPVNWMLPETQPYSLSIVVKVDAAGTVLSCKAASTFVFPLIPAPCDRFAVGASSGFHLQRGTKAAGGTVTITSAQTVQTDR